MNYIVEDPEKKQAFLEELLRSFKYVKARRISALKAVGVKDMLDALDELREIESGKRKPRSMKALLREL